MRAPLRRALFALILFVALQELVLRWAFPVPELLNFDRSHYSPLALGAASGGPTGLGHASYGWASEPDGYRFVHQLNLYGFRDRDWRLRPHARRERIAFVGDSFVEGFGAEADATLPAAFGSRAGEQGVAVDVLNFGIGGAGLAEYWRLLADVLPLFRPDDAVLVLYENDLIPRPYAPSWLESPIRPETASRFEPRFLRVLRQRSAGRRVPRRWIEDPFPYLPAVPDPRNPWSREAEAARLSRFVAPEIGAAMRRGAFNPALADWFPWAERSLPKPVDLTPHLRALKRQANTGQRLLVVYVPTKSQVTDRYLAYQAEYSPKGAPRSLTGKEFQVHARWLARSCTALGIPFLDLTPVLRDGEAAGPELYWRYDDHLRPAGYRAAGRAIFDWWLTLPRPASPRRAELPSPPGRAGRGPA